MYHTKEELIAIDDCEIHFIFDSLTTADDYQLWWLVETDPLENSKVHSHPIDPEHLYYYDHDRDWETIEDEMNFAIINRN